MCNDDDECDGYVIPKGTIVIGNSWWGLAIVHILVLIGSFLEGRPYTTLKYIRSLKNTIRIVGLSMGNSTPPRKIHPSQHLDMAAGQSSAPLVHPEIHWHHLQDLCRETFQRWIAVCHDIPYPFCLRYQSSCRRSSKYGTPETRGNIWNDVIREIIFLFCATNLFYHQVPCPVPVQNKATIWCCWNPLSAGLNLNEIVWFSNCEQLYNTIFNFPS